MEPEARARSSYAAFHSHRVRGELGNMEQRSLAVVRLHPWTDWQLTWFGYIHEPIGI